MSPRTPSPPSPTSADPSRGAGRDADSSPGRDLLRSLAAPSVAVLTWTLVAGVLFAAIGAGTVLAGSPTYESRAVLLIDQPRAIAASGDAGVIQKLSQLRFKYTPLVRTEPIIERAATASQLSPGEIRRGAAATAPPLTLTVLAIGRDSDADTAVAIANAIASGLAQFVADEQEADGVPPEERIVLSTVAPAQGAVEIEPTDQRVAAVAVTLGLLAAFVMYVALSAVEARRGASRESGDEPGSV